MLIELLADGRTDGHPTHFIRSSRRWPKNQCKLLLLQRTIVYRKNKIDGAPTRPSYTMLIYYSRVRAISFLKIYLNFRWIYQASLQIGNVDFILNFKSIVTIHFSSFHKWISSENVSTEQSIPEVSPVRTIRTPTCSEHQSYAWRMHIRNSTRAGGRYGSELS